MLDCNYIDLFTFTFFLLRPASVTWQRTYTTLKLLNYFFDHLHWKHVPLTISFYIRQMRHISSSVQSCTYAAHQRSKYGMWAKIFKYLPPFQQCKGMPADCFCNPNFCVIYTLNHLLFWPYRGFIFHFIQPNCQLLLTSMVLLHLFWKYVPSAIPMLETAIMWPTECARAVYCFRKKNNTQKAKNPK